MYPPSLRQSTPLPSTLLAVLSAELYAKHTWYPPLPVRALRVTGSPRSAFNSTQVSAPPFPGPTSMSRTVRLLISPVTMPTFQRPPSRNISRIFAGSFVPSFAPCEPFGGCFPMAVHAASPQAHVKSSVTPYALVTAKPQATYFSAHSSSSVIAPLHSASTTRSPSSQHPRAAPARRRHPHRRVSILGLRDKTSACRGRR